MNILEVLAEQLDRSREWTKLLLADIDGDDWTYQPEPGMAHALWLAGHLASAQNSLIHVRVLGLSPMPSEFSHHFPIGAPVKSANEHDYPSAEHVIRVMDTTHADTLNLVRDMDPAILSEPALGKGGKPHPHYGTKLTAITHCNRHEAFHAGQIASLRRLMGKSFLR